ncbi:hypothetical protein CAPTEDRAFT_178894 [Capitella teleta]|uniref:Sulfatase N-terminal domain-containing protein n=1 Tax=Capitella teleta TaxID=283909 RepID=R7U1M8_CAPTE|nr:hypothetical protein CAPTEDRAFT_178894 [Capitella teleta]|eukprot:ELT97571.1 hypothetical protein CAPTEDRAFT_178894 [Capitella teleta]
MSPTGLFALSKCLAVLCITLSQPVLGASKQPNILFILADDYGYHDVGYHGSAIRTPNIDRLAFEGVRLENYYVQPICTPTRSQLLSGRYQIHTGLQHSIIWAAQPNALPKELPTLADKLREEGYANHIVGKWHLGFYKEEYVPTNRGFDSFYGYLTGSEFYYNKTYCLAQINRSDVCGLDFRENDRSINESEYSTHLYAERTKQLVADHTSAHPDQPLFLYLALQSVHGPLEVPAQYRTPYKHIKDENRQIYAGMVSCMDEAVKNVTDAFKKYGLWDNTILVFSTDNGGQVAEGGNNWPLRGWKGSLWDGGMRGVGFVHSTLLKQKGAVAHQLMHVSDWFPTLLNQAGGNASSVKLDGFDQWAAISDGAEGPRTEILHNIDPLNGKRGKRTEEVFDNTVRAALRMNKWKLLTGEPGNGSWVPPPERELPTKLDPSSKKQNIWLFDIEADPYEISNVAAENPEVVKTMLLKLAAYNATAVPPFYPPYDPRSYPENHGGVWGPWM